VPASLAAIVERCVAKNPAERYTRAEELLAELDALADETFDACHVSDRRIVVQPRRSRARALAVFVMVVLLASLAGVYAVTRDPGAAAVPDAATRLAVLPFHAAGPVEVHEVGRGMVDLLTPALNDVGGIHTVPARTVLARMPGEGQSPLLPLDELLRVGRDVGAESVL